MRRKKQKVKRYNYSFLILTLLPLLCGPLSRHINILNAVAGCPKFDQDDYRYFQLTTANYRGYLTEMKKEKRNPTTPMRQFFAQGTLIEQDSQHPIPNATIFTDIAFGLLTFKYRSYELEFREAVRDVLTNGQNKHMEQVEIDDLLKSSDSDDIYEFVFKCFRTAIMCGGNTAQRVPRKSKLKEVELRTIRDVEKMSPSTREELRMPDDDSKDDNNDNKDNNDSKDNNAT